MCISSSINGTNNNTLNLTINYTSKQAAIQHAWKSYGFQYHLLHMTVYIAFLTVLSITNYEFSNFVSSDDRLSIRRGLGWNYAFIALTSVFAVIGILQFSRAPFKYLRAYINFIDLSAYA